MRSSVRATRLGPKPAGVTLTWMRCTYARRRWRLGYVCVCVCVGWGGGGRRRCPQASFVAMCRRHHDGGTLARVLAELQQEGGGDTYSVAMHVPVLCACNREQRGVLSAVSVREAEVGSGADCCAP